jgi:hypothetical protein
MSYHFYQPPNTSRSRQSEECRPLPSCPTCGDLECICRPRFFAGQLLTEEDLNRLQRYVIEKNKLHNRYLHGWGVVCGLEVVCSPCHNMLRVKSGYALSPCGEDIIVCKDDTVDVCALIQACRPVSPYPDCEPPRRGSDEDCQEVTEDWVLAICYDEKPSRGITALRGSSGAACCSRCSCGGSSACGCSCHHSYTNGGKKNGNGCRPTQPNPPQCEPTLTCEGYFYRVYKAPKRKEDERRDRGALITRVLACLNELTQEIGALPGANSARQQRYEWCCSFKETLRDFLVTQGIYDCQLADKLATIRCPDPARTNADFETEWQNALQQLGILLWEFLKYCFCSTLLPPCPEPVTDDCVPLATITVRRRDCRIVQVCNWGPRKFAITLPNLGYWLSVLTPYAQFLREAIERICCRPLQFREATFNTFAFHRSTSGGAPNISPNTLTNTATTGTTGTRAKMTPEREFSTLFYQALLNPERGFDAQTLLVLNALGAANSQGNPPLSELESRNPLQFLLLNQVVAPLIRSSIPERTGGLEMAGLGAGVPEAMSAQADELATLRETVEQLKKKVDELSSRPANR